MKNESAYKRTFKLIDKKGNRFDIEAEITTRNGYREFTSSGKGMGSLGQCQDSIVPANKHQKEYLRYWKKYHLQPVGTMRKFQDDLESLINAIEEADGQRLGINCAEMEVKEIKKYIEDEGLSFANQDCIIALAKLYNVPLGEIKDIEENKHYRYTVQGTDYIAGTDEEMDEVATEEIKQSLWAFTPSFLSGYTGISEEVFEVLSKQCESANDAVLSIIESKGDIKDFAQEAMRADGRGHFLNHYDGGEDEMEVNGVTYYSYQS